MKKRIISALMMVMLVCSTCLSVIDVMAATREEYNLPAEFTVTEEITNQDIEAWTFTAADSCVGSSSSITNQMITGGGFEPVVYRSKYTATANAGNIVHVNQSALTSYDTYADGFLDGGTATVYRPRNGKLELVRTSKISKYNANGKNRQFSNKAVSTNYAYVGWDDWERNDYTYYFAVVAVDSSGRESPVSNWVGVNKRPGYKNKGTVENANSFSSVTSNGTVVQTLAVPTNLAYEYDDSLTRVKLTWTSSAGAAGYVIYKSYYPPEEQAGYYLELEPDSTQIKQNDMVFVYKKFYDWSRIKYNTPRVYGAGEANVTNMFSPKIDGQTLFSDENPDITYELVPHGDVPEEFNNAGETCIMLDMKGTGAELSQKATFQIYNHAGPNGNNGQENNYYRIMEPGEKYIVEFWAKAEGGKKTRISYRFSRFNQDSDSEVKSVTPTEDWKKYSFEYIVPEGENLSKWIGESLLDVYGPGKVYIDSYSVYRADTPPNQWSETDIAAARDSGFEYYRCHTFIKSGRITYDMKTLCNPSGGTSKAVSGCATLDSYLKICKAAKLNPWFQLEMFMEPDEWKGWVEYMSATYNPKIDSPQTKPYAYKRYLAGQEKPWIDEFSNIIFEVSNETWNSLFAPWNYSDMTDEATEKSYKSSEVYGLHHELIIQIMKESPYWNRLAPKFKSVLGGWSNGDYEINAAKHTGNADYITRAWYNGGWDEGTNLSDNTAGFFSTAVFGIQSSKKSAENFMNNRNTAGINLPMGTYEAGPGYMLPEGNPSEAKQAEFNAQNRVQKSLAAAASTLDCFLMNAAYYDFDIQNFFTFSRSKMFWTSHSDIKDGGQEHVPFRALTMFNNYGTGSFVKVNDISVPKLDIPAVAGRAAAQNSPMIAAYATKTADKYSVFVVSRKISDYPNAGDDGYTPVTLNLPFSTVKKIKARKMVGTYSDNNLSEDKIKIQEMDIPAIQFNKKFVLNEAAGAEDKGVAPCSIYMYEFYLSDQPDAPAFSKIEAADGDCGTDLSWNVSTDTDRVFVYRSEKEKGVYTKIGSVSVDKEKVFIDRNGEIGKEYFYKVRAFNGDIYTDSEIIGKVYNYSGGSSSPESPTPEATGTPANEETPTGTPIETQTGTATPEDTSTAAPTEMMMESPTSTIEPEVNKPKRPKIKVAKVKKGKKLKRDRLAVSWKSVKGQFYMVSMSSKKKGKYTTVKKYTKNLKKFIKKGLKKNKRYFFKVRTYKVNAGKKVYSKFSKIKGKKV